MKSNKSNLLYFFLFCLLSSFFSSCNSDSVNIDKVVPNVHLDVTLDLTHHNELTNNTALYFDDVYGERVGYKNHGIIVFRANEEYYAFDATCTNDVDSNEHVELGDPNDKDSWNGVAECPVCNSKFLIQAGGAVPIEKSIAKYPLKQYRTVKTGNKLRIYNKY